MLLINPQENSRSPTRFIIQEHDMMLNKKKYVCHGINITLIQERPVFSKQTANSAYSYNLPEPLTVLKLHQHQLISGNKMV